MPQNAMNAPRDPQRQGRANVRLGLVLASVALAFFAGFLVKMMYFGR
jgi:hypothetical protein